MFLERSADSDWRGWDSSKCALSFLSKDDPGTHRSDSPPQTAFSESTEERSRPSAAFGSPRVIYMFEWQASITAAPARRMSYYLDPVSSCQALHPPDCLGVMRTSGGMAVSLVPHTQSPAVFHPAPPRPLYGHHITLQEVPNGPEYCQSENECLHFFHAVVMHGYNLIGA
ncbi:unnamed protein product [Leuciscus chuanchicus]